jgi:hypothetical protein
MNEKFTDAQIAAFLKRSYFAVDGLWFLKSEEQHGLSEAMDLDEAVWEIMPKVQAREAAKILDLEGGSLQAVQQGFEFKLTAEGYDFDVETSGDEVRFIVKTCPWYEVLKKCDRTHLAESIADRICTREFSGWTKELAPGTEFELRSRLCVESDNCECCRLVFRQVEDD